MSERVDVVVIGAGHNGLVAATLLGRAGLDVLVLERASVVGGAARTERPFAAAPGLGASTGAYLLGPMPPELLDELGLELPLIRRDPHYFLPTTGDRHLLLGSDRDDARRQFEAFFSPADLEADDALRAELAALRDDLAPSWLEEPGSVEDTADRFVRRDLQEVFVDLVRGTVADYLDRFGFDSDLLVAMYAATDGAPGVFADLDTPGSGANFLVHNMTRLPGSDGTWMIVRGGMGTVTGELARLARAAGADVETGCEVTAVTRDGDRVTGVQVGSREVAAEAVVSNADPFRLRDLVGRDALPASLNQRIDRYATRPGSTFKLNLALADLPTFTSLPEPRGQHGTTIHLLPEDDPLGSLRAAFAAATEGRLPDTPPVEWYLHTAVDPSLRDREGRHSGALFVQWVPYQPAEGSWDDLADGFSDRLLEICDRYAPGTSDLVVDRQPLHPAAIEAHFGLTRGHIFQVDNTWAYDERLPYALPLGGLYACGAACHPGGSVTGVPGRNAARRILSDLGRA